MTVVCIISGGVSYGQKVCLLGGKQDITYIRQEEVPLASKPNKPKDNIACDNQHIPRHLHQNNLTRLKSDKSFLMSTQKVLYRNGSETRCPLQQGRLVLTHHRPPSRITGAVSRTPGQYRTLFGTYFSNDRTQRVECTTFLSEDAKILQAATEPLKYLFPHRDWDHWGIELVEGHEYLCEVLPQEQTIVIERHGAGELALLSWDVFGAFFRFILEDEYEAYLQEDDAQRFALYAQLCWFQQESSDWQYEMLASLALPGMDQRDLAGLLWSLLPPQRASRFGVLLRDQALPRQPLQDTTTPTENCWQQANAYLQRPPSSNIPTPAAPQQPQPSTSLPIQQIEKLRQLFSVCSLLSWDAFCSPLPGLLARYIHETEADSSSTERRLSLFRVCAEQAISKDQLQLSPHNWPYLSLSVLNAQRHPRIHQALIQYQSHITKYPTTQLWSIQDDDDKLDQLALHNQLGEQDDRFFRQATHLQAIWRDILHRSASQEWAAKLLFDAIELLISSIQEKPELFFAAVTWSQDSESSNKAFHTPIHNLRELLWVLSQAPQSALTLLYPRASEDTTQAQKAWPLTHKHLRRFLHLAPTALQKHLDQVEEEHQQQPQEEDILEHIEFESDREIPQQDLKGRIIPLLSRPEMLQHRWINIEDTVSLRIIHLDRHLHKSSGKIREQRFFSSFLFFFKTEQDRHEGGWSELALWIDKDLDLGKLANKRSLSPTIRGLLLEDGIWERTYRYQFLTMDQLLKKLQPGHKEWKSLLRLLCREYRPLYEKRVRELLDYQFYTTRGRLLGKKALRGKVTDENTHPLLRLSIDEYEAVKEDLVTRIIDHGLEAFKLMQSQDDRNWHHAHQTIAQTVRHISLLLHLPPGGFFIKPTELEKGDCRSWSWEILQQWSEHPDEFYHVPPTPQLWIDEKVELVERLERIHPAGSVRFVHFLLNQLSPQDRLVKILQPLQSDENEPFQFSSLSSSTPLQKQKVFTPFLKSQDGELTNPTFLYVLSHLSKHVLRETIDRHPEQLDALKKARQLLRELDEEDQSISQFCEHVDEIVSSRTKKPSQTKEKVTQSPDLQDQSPSS